MKEVVRGTCPARSLRGPRRFCGLHVVAQWRQEEQVFHMEDSSPEANGEPFSQAGLFWDGVGGRQGY